MEKYHGGDEAMPTHCTFCLWDQATFNRPCWMFVLNPRYANLAEDKFFSVAIAYGHCPFGGSAKEPANADWLDCAPIGMQLHVPVDARLCSSYFNIADATVLEAEAVPLFAWSKRFI